CLGSPALAAHNVTVELASEPPPTWTCPSIRTAAAAGSEVKLSKPTISQTQFISCDLLILSIARVCAPAAQAMPRGTARREGTTANIANALNNMVMTLAPFSNCLEMILLLREHELHLRADLPVRLEVRAHDVVVSGKLCVHRQLAQMEDP